MGTGSRKRRYYERNKHVDTCFLQVYFKEICENLQRFSEQSKSESLYLPCKISIFCHSY